MPHRALYRPIRPTETPQSPIVPHKTPPEPHRIPPPNRPLCPTVSPQALPRALYLRGRALLVTPLGSPRAEAILGRALKLEPGLSGAWTLLGETLWGRGDLDGARACFRGALQHVSVLLWGTVGLWGVLRVSMGLCGALWDLSGVSVGRYGSIWGTTGSLWGTMGL